MRCPIPVRGSFIGFVLVCSLCAFAPAQIAAQEPSGAEQKPEQPFAVVSFAGVDRLMAALDFSFETADRPEASEAVGGFLDRAGELKGINRDQSFGLMIFLAGIVPQPVGFVPVDKIEDLMKTIEIGPFTTKKISADRYEMKGRRNSVHIRTVGRYAFVSRDEKRLDRIFPDSAKITAPLVASYDIAASVNLRSLPQTTKDLFATLLQASADANLQRRDGESESSHRIRKAMGENHSRLLEQLLREGEELTLGWKVSEKERHAALELVARATPGSELAGLLNELNTTKSQFAGFLTGDAPLTFSASWKLDKGGKKALTEIVETLEKAVSGEDEVEPAADDPIGPMFSALRGTVAAGSLDFALRFLGEPPGPFVLAAGLKVTDGRAMEAGLAELCTQWSESGAFSEVELDVDKYQGIRFHRLEPSKAGQGAERIYGGKPSLYLGVGPRTFWMAMGGDEALPMLYEQIDTVAATLKEKPRPTVPLQFVANISSWLSMRRETDSPGRFRRTVNEAFTGENDSLRIDVRSVENGARLRVQFDEAFLRFIGLSLARRFTRE